MALSGALALLAFIGGDRRAAASLALITFTLFAVQFWKVAGLGDAIWLAFGASWMMVAGVIYGAIYRGDAKSRHADTSCLVLIGVSMCYLIGRAYQMPFTNDAKVLIWADILGVLAWLIMAGPGLASLVGNIVLAWGRGGPRYSGWRDFAEKASR